MAYSRQTLQKSLPLFLFSAFFCMAFLLSFLELPNLQALHSWALRLFSLALLCFFLGMHLRRDFLKSLLFSLAAIFAALGAGECYLKIQDGGNMEAASPISAVPPEFAEEVRERFDPKDLAAAPAGAQKIQIKKAIPAEEIVSDLETAKSFFTEAGLEISPNALTPAEAKRPDSQLGYRLAAHAAQILAVKRSPSGLVYRSIYTLSPEGWRITPHHPEAKNAVIFLGCSFTFGEGLNDQETYPYKVGELLGSDYQVFNFGVSGYGTHQALALVENGYLDDIAHTYRNIYVFHMTHPAHALRNAGKSSWDQDGPCYAIVEDGGVAYQGTFREARKQASQSKSLLLKKFNENKYITELHLAMLKHLHQKLLQRFNTELTVIKIFNGKNYLDTLQEEGVPMMQLLPEPLPEHTIRGDGHPSALAASIFADKIARFILEKTNP